jgi:hypothetical protein
VTVKRTDEVISMANHAGQACEELKRIDEDFVYVERFVGDLKILARGFKPAPPDTGYLKINANVKKDDPVEELEFFTRYLKLTIENLDRAAELLKQRRAAIEDLLKP